MESTHFTEIKKLRPRIDMLSATKNRIGTPAADFAYCTASNSVVNMYAHRAPYTLIYFHKPGCHECELTSDAMMRSELLADLTRTRQITVLAIYPGKDLAAWNAGKRNYPTRWIDAHSAGIGDELYDLQAIPSLYLLGSDKTVLLKDADFKSVEQFSKDFSAHIR